MKEITVQDCIKLKEDFDNYLATAEQHEYPLLFIIDIKLTQSLAEIKKVNKVEDQKEARAMFRSVLMVLGKDTSEYKEENYEGGN